MTAQAPELLPCPFCGSPGKWYGPSVGCSSDTCPALLVPAKGIERAAEAWNRRTERWPIVARELAIQLEDALDECEEQGYSEQWLAPGRAAVDAYIATAGWPGLLAAHTDPEKGGAA